MKGSQLGGKASDAPRDIACIQQICPKSQGQLMESICQGKTLGRQGQRQGPGWRGSLFLLGIGFLQQAGPKLQVVVARMHEEVRLVQDR